MTGVPAVLVWRPGGKAAPVAAVAHILAAASVWGAAAAADAAADESPVRYRTLPFPPSYVPGYGGVSDLCWLQCPLSNKNSKSKRFRSEVTIRGGMCASALDANMLPSQYHLDDERLAATLATAWSRDGPALARRVSESVETFPTPGRDRPCRPVTDDSGGAYSYVDAGVDGQGDVAGGTVVLGREDNNNTIPDPTGDGGGFRATLYDNQLFKPLSLQRNTLLGGFARHTGKFEVLAAHSAVVGVCIDVGCRSPAAIDMATASALLNCSAVSGGPAGRGDDGGCGLRASLAGTPVLTYLGAGWTREAIVPMFRRDLLSLGRGLLARSDWIGNRSAEYRLNAAVEQTHPAYREPDGRLRQDRDTVTIGWTLDGETPPHWAATNGRHPDPDWQPLQVSRSGVNATGWPDALAYILCSGRRDTFVQDVVRLCDGVTPFRTVVDAGGAPFDGLVGPEALLATTWVLDPGLRPVSVPEPAGVVVNLRTSGLYHSQPYPPDPLFLGRGLRELDPDSLEERILALSLKQRVLLLNIASQSTNLVSGVLQARRLRPRVLASLNGELARLSGQYDRSVFGLEEPQDPANPTDIILSVLVVVPELVAVAHYFLHTPAVKWGPRRLLFLLLLIVLLMLSLLAIGSLAVSEVAGAAWRSTARRAATTINWAPTADSSLGAMYGVAGALVAHHEAVLVIARNGYAPTRVVRVAVATASVSVAAVAPMVLYALVMAVRHRGRRGGLLAPVAVAAFAKLPGGGGSGGSSSGKGGGGVPPPAAAGAGGGTTATPASGGGFAGGGGRIPAGGGGLGGGVTSVLGGATRGVGRVGRTK